MSDEEAIWNVKVITIKDVCLNLSGAEEQDGLESAASPLT